MKQYSKRKILGAAVGAGLMVIAGAPLAHNDKPHATTGPVKKEQKDWGIAGDAKQAKRTITEDSVIKSGFGRSVIGPLEITPGVILEIEPSGILEIV